MAIKFPLNIYYDFFSGNNNYQFIIPKEIMKFGVQDNRKYLVNTDWFNRAHQILHTHKLNFRPFRLVLSKMFTTLERNISDEQLVTHILHALQNKSNSMFSSLINKLFSHEFYNEYNLLYYLLGIRGKQPIKFNVMNFIKKEFPTINWIGANTLFESDMTKNSESETKNQNWVYEESNMNYNKNLHERVNQVLLNNKLNFSNLRYLLNKVSPYQKCDISDEQLLSNLLHVFQYKIDSAFSTLIQKLFNHKFDNEYNALYYILGIKGDKPVRFNIADFVTNEFYNSVTKKNDYKYTPENNNLGSQLENIISHNNNNNAFGQQLVANNLIAETPVFNSDVIISHDLSETNNWVSPEENIIIYKTNNDSEQQFVANNQIVDTTCDK